ALPPSLRVRAGAAHGERGAERVTRDRDLAARAKVMSRSETPTFGTSCRARRRSRGKRRCSDDGQSEMFQIDNASSTSSPRHGAPPEVTAPGPRTLPASSEGEFWNQGNPAT